jgi:hypothetical protein
MDGATKLIAWQRFWSCGRRSFVCGWSEPEGASSLEAEPDAEAADPEWPGELEMTEVSKEHERAASYIPLWIRR